MIYIDAHFLDVRQLPDVSYKVSTSSRSLTQIISVAGLSILGGSKKRIRDFMAHSRPTEELLAMSDVVLHHEVPIQPPDTRDDHLIRRRNRYTAAASALQALSAARALDSLNSLQTSTTLSNTPRRLPRST